MFLSFLFFFQKKSLFTLSVDFYLADLIWTKQFFVVFTAHRFVVSMREKQPNVSRPKPRSSRPASGLPANRSRSEPRSEPHTPLSSTLIVRRTDPDASLVSPQIARIALTGCDDEFLTTASFSSSSTTTTFFLMTNCKLMVKTTFYHQRATAFVLLPLRG